jgi:hypothetical protein
MLELRLSAGNESFSGQVRSYAELDEPEKFAAVIEGFPRSPSDVREYSVGSAVTMTGYGGAKLRFSCKGGRGHVAVQVSVHSTPMDGNPFVESATVQIETVPSDVDSFVRSLRRMGCEVDAVAVLRHPN